MTQRRAIHVSILTMIFIACLTLFIACQPRAEGKYWIKVIPHVTGSFKVEADIQTNIPDAVTLSLSLGLSGQRPNDIFIGTEYIKVPIANGRGSAMIDGTMGVFPRESQLPAGNYNVEASFYPYWPENAAIASKLGITKPIVGKALVELHASGTSVDVAIMKADGRKWVMQNVTSGMEWDPHFWKSKFGAYQELKYNGRGNPRILKMYYFTTIDMTLMVNSLKKEIETYRMGMQNE